MTQKELATRTGLSVVTLNRIFKGEQPISYETANKLELVTGTPAAFWNNLEARYREQLAKLKQQAELERDLDWLKCVPVAELQSRKVVSEAKDKVLQLREVLGFFGVSGVKAWHDFWSRPTAAARKSKCYESSPGPTAVWLRLGQLKARQIDCEPFSKSRFQVALRAIRSLTPGEPEEFVPEMTRLCAQSGVAVTLVPELKKAPWSGAAEWLAPDKAMILLNLRGKWEDRFWFTFFHEAGHILLDSKKERHIDDGKTYANDPAETRADEFASEILIPGKHNDRIKSVRAAREITQIAKDLGIAPGIVAGRFQHLTKKWTHFNALKRRFEWEPGDYAA